ncbi:hypothetical protein PEDI_41000 [Persicobacter diffluens]|uniref:Uncharacterized protein n=1 Tax=Persicobacter diffluens TaxID=981 RepID=A0AAN4W1D6_9BACT|nr:hypothetical protein PEDI_41000 [Persicobacter diffluens]
MLKFLIQLRGRIYDEINPNFEFFPTKLMNEEQVSLSKFELFED